MIVGGDREVVVSNVQDNDGKRFIDADSKWRLFRLVSIAENKGPNTRLLHSA